MVFFHDALYILVYLAIVGGVIYALIGGGK